MKNTLILMTATIILLATACRNQAPQETAEPVMPATDTVQNGISKLEGENGRGNRHNKGAEKGVLQYLCQRNMPYSS